MALPGAYAQYNNSKVLTASPAELTLMLYDGAIKFCNIAIVAVEKKDAWSSMLPLQVLQDLQHCVSQRMQSPACYAVRNM